MDRLLSGFCKNVLSLICVFPFQIPAQEQYNANQAGITAAIVIAVLIPVGLALFCLFLKIRDHIIERREAEVGTAT